MMHAGDANSIAMLHLVGLQATLCSTAHFIETLQATFLMKYVSDVKPDMATEQHIGGFILLEQLTPQAVVLCCISSTRTKQCAEPQSTIFVELQQTGLYSTMSSLVCSTFATAVTQ